MGYILNGVETGGIPLRFVNRLISQHKVKWFVETGTAGGDSVRSVAPLFDHCHTIELIEGRPQGEFHENVVLHQGHSVDRLPEILELIEDNYDGYVLFWLDAHYSDPEPNKSDNHECPVLEEIEIVASYKHPVILIDDARLFYGHPPYPNDPREWPTLQQIFLKFHEVLPNHFVTIFDDYIVALPMEMVDTFQEEWRGFYKFRYPDENGQLKQAIKKLMVKAKEWTTDIA